MTTCNNLQQIKSKSWTPGEMREWIDRAGERTAQLYPNIDEECAMMSNEIEIKKEQYSDESMVDESGYFSTDDRTEIYSDSESVEQSIHDQTMGDESEYEEESGMKFITKIY